MNDPPALDIPRTTLPAFRSSKRSFIRSMTLSLANLTSSASMAVRERRATAKSTWTQASRAIRVCRAQTTIGRFRRVEVCESEAPTRSQTSTILTIHTGCFRRAPAHTTFPKKVTTSCRRYRTRLIWPRATASSRQPTPPALR